MKPSEVLKKIAMRIASEQNLDYYSLTPNQKNVIYISAFMEYMDNLHEEQSPDKIYERYQDQVDTIDLK